MAHMRYAVGPLRTLSRQPPTGQVRLCQLQLSGKWPCSLAASTRGAAQVSESSAFEFSVYRSSVDLGTAVAAAQRKCQVGAGLGAVGFLGVAASMASSAPPSAMVLLLVGAAANGYSQLSHKPTLLKSLALRHVEELVLVQPEQPEQIEDAGQPKLALADGATVDQQEAPSPPESGEEAAPEKAAPEKEPMPEVADAEAADSAKEPAISVGGTAWIKSAAELQLKIRCANIERHVTLTEPAAPWEGARFSGLVADDRVTIGDLCRHSRFLHVDTNAGESSNRQMLVALMRSGKVIKEERMELRTDVVEALRLSDTAAASIPGAKLSEVKPEDIKRMAKIPVRETLVAQINGVGQRAVATGIAILGASILFTQRPNAQDPKKDMRLRYLFFDKPE